MPHLESLNNEDGRTIFYNATKLRPPVEIFDILHEAECAGIKLPDIVDKWWAKETEEIW